MYRKGLRHPCAHFFVAFLTGFVVRFGKRCATAKKTDRLACAGLVWRSQTSRFEVGGFELIRAI